WVREGIDDAGPYVPLSDRQSASSAYWSAIYKVHTQAPRPPQSAPLLRAPQQCAETPQTASPLQRASLQRVPPTTRVTAPLPAAPSAPAAPRHPGTPAPAAPV